MSSASPPEITYHASATACIGLIGDVLGVKLYTWLLVLSLVWCAAMIGAFLFAMIEP